MTSSVKRLVVTGSECTGKTTLAAALAARYDVPMAPEFVRGYAAAAGHAIGVDDHWPIARGQVAVQDATVANALRLERPLVIFDTDLLSTVAYAWHYTGQCDPGVEAMARARVADHYLLLDIDVPWIADGVRDRGDQRRHLHTLFRDTLTRFGAPFTLISGSWDERFAAAVGNIDALLHQT
ncbi:MAG: NadR-like protein [Gemmatimonadaceae bacterium]|jgi:NadR type nicotinamide-nucleotide adenylyltransferase|nr:NadR-like protein [Gemmatimonadaceae bacterium]